MDPGAYEGADTPTRSRSDEARSAPAGGGRPRRPGQQPRGVPGFIRFVVFAGLLATVIAIAGLTALRPLVRAAVVGWAWQNTGALRLPFVAGFVREDLGVALTNPASSDASEVVFEVQLGDTPATLAPRLLAAGVIASERAFIFTAVVDGLAARLKEGRYLLRKDMTPEQVSVGLVSAPVVVTSIDVLFREGLRLEQITAKLQTLTSGVDPKAFYDEVTKPPPTLLVDFPWLKLAAGATLEGYLYPATYSLITEARGDPLQHVTNADDLVRAMLTKFHDVVGDQRMAVPAGRGLSWTEILTLASMVETEAHLDVDRPLIAGVFQTRLDPKHETRGFLQSDPTIFYINDTLELRALPFASWQLYSFWGPIKQPLPDVLPDDLAAYNTYTHAGLPPGPLVSPSTASIDAALHPDTSTGYLYFLAVGDGTTVYAKTLAEHRKNIAKYLK